MDVDSGRILYSEIPEAATVVYRIEDQPGYMHSSLPRPTSSRQATASRRNPTARTALGD